MRYVLRNDEVTFGVVRVSAPMGVQSRVWRVQRAGLALLGLGVQGVAGSQNGLVVSGMALLRRHVAYATVLVLPDTQKNLVNMGHKRGEAQDANHLAAIGSRRTQSGRQAKWRKAFFRCQ